MKTKKWTGALVLALSGLAATYEPDRLLTAKQALDRAEVAHADDPGSARERHLAYLAHRAAETANVYGQLAVNEQDKELAQQDHERTQDQARTRARARLEQSEQALENTEQSLRLERQERAKIEARLRKALESLHHLAMVKEEERGLVITLNGSVLFASGRSELLPTAKDHPERAEAARRFAAAGAVPGDVPRADLVTLSGGRPTRAFPAASRRRAPSGGG